MIPQPCPLTIFPEVEIQLLGPVLLLIPQISIDLLLAGVDPHLRQWWG